MFTEDTMIHPKETAHFQSPSPAGNSVLTWDQMDFYNKDYIGLKALNEAGKVTLDAWVGDHLQFSNDQITNIVVPFLNK